MIPPSGPLEKLTNAASKALNSGLNSKYFSTSSPSIRGRDFSAAMLFVQWLWPIYSWSIKYKIKCMTVQPQVCITQIESPRCVQGATNKRLTEFKSPYLVFQFSSALLLCSVSLYATVIITTIGCSTKHMKLTSVFNSPPGGQAGTNLPTQPTTNYFGLSHDSNLILSEMNTLQIYHPVKICLLNKNNWSAQSCWRYIL